MLAEGNDMRPNVAKAVVNVPLARKAFRLTDQMRIYGEALDKFLSDHYKLSDATHTWIGLFNNEVI